MTLALAGAMVFGMSATAFAADSTSSSDKGSITISGLTANNTGTMTAYAYQIAAAQYDDAGNFTGYAMVSGTESCAFQIGTYGSYDDDALTEANLAELFSAVENNGATKSATVDVDAIEVTISDLPVGAYLIVISGSESTVYGMMIGSVYYDVDDSAWSVENGTINISDTEVGGVTVWAKATQPSVLKEETGGSLGDYEHGGSANVGDTITYHITIDNIPTYEGEYPSFVLDDVISDEMTINFDSIEVITPDTLTKDTDYVVTQVSATEFTIDFAPEYHYCLNGVDEVVVQYTATVMSAKASADDHENDVTLTYATTSYRVDGGNGTDADEDHEYTFAFSAQKLDQDNAALAGATFTVYDSTEAEVASQTSGEDGMFTFTGLKEGTYTMKETKAPAGYAINTTVYTIEISATYSAQTSKMGGSLSSWGIAITGTDGTDITVTSNAATGLTVVDNHVGMLPSMGGRGTLMFTIIGCAIVAAAACGVVATRKRRIA